MASWNSEMLGVFFLAPMVLTLAVPRMRPALRWNCATTVLLVSFFTSVGIAVT